MKEKDGLSGIIVIDKPGGMTSHDVVRHVRKRFGMKRVGHAGTLDPLATGVLVILLGKGTKLFNKFEQFDKAYLATLLLGTKTDTADIQGKVLEERSYAQVEKGHVEEVLKEFRGEFKQMPPMVSAVKVGGKRLYELARKGIKVEREPRQVRIDVLKIVSFSRPDVQFYLECSKGTYVRQLAEDVGERLGCGACITQIQRTKVGPFELESAVKLDDIDEDHVIQWKGVPASVG